MIKIVEVNDKKTAKDFLRFPLELYKGNEYIVPPLLSDEADEFNPEKNGAFEFCEARRWVAYNEKGKGKVTIPFDSDDDLMRLMSLFDMIVISNE